MAQPTGQDFELWDGGMPYRRITGTLSTLGLDLFVWGSPYRTLAGVTVSSLFGATVVIGAQDALLAATVEELTPRLYAKVFDSVALGGQDGILVAVVGEEVN